MKNNVTPLQFIMVYNNNNIYIKRDDLNLLPFGGNKVRKLELFLEDAKRKNADYIVTYGSSQSNHCRLTVEMATRTGFKVLLILAKDNNINYNGNFLFYDLYDIEIVLTDTNNVPETIEHTLKQLQYKGYSPYFIQGGGHGDLGTHAYRIAYEEIITQEKEMDINFSYIFHASGTGTTQAGLIAGNIINKYSKEIIGISVARNKKRGYEVIKESVESYFQRFLPKFELQKFKINFNDNYIGNGYADVYPEIIETVKKVIKSSGIILDPVYTGKAFYGMLDYISKNDIEGKNILFIHTGGLPLLFNYAEKFRGSK